ncbi:3'-5' exonuclease [Erwinia sp. CPCC 100877]|nr:3'-5' exonuclease [Erwinia sp. CPCC 100877]
MLPVQAKWPTGIQSIIQTPLPPAETDIRQLPLLVFDFETSGLNAEQDRIVSMGWVEVHQGIIALESARHLLLQASSDTDRPAVALHHIVPEMQQRGVSEATAFDQLWSAMAGKALVVHGAVMEREFICQYLRRGALPELPLIWLDTLKIEQAFPTSRERGPVSWRLSDLRRRYRLPEYPAHHALSDAIATAELFLAQRFRLFRQQAAPLGELVKASR